MRRTAPAAITPQMYRHFATATIAITAMLAFFANGEKQQAVAAETAAAHPEPAKPVKAAKAHPAAAKVVAATASGWGQDSDPAFGLPTLAAAGSVGSWVSSAAAWQPALAQRGYDAGYLSRLSSEDRTALTQAMADNIGADDSAAQAKIAAAAAASRLRSGAPQQAE